MRETPIKSRSYGESCPVAHALDLIGERWSLIILRELRLGPRRYADLESTLSGISPSVLAQRLRELVLAGVIYRRMITAPTKARVYDLTDWGRELEPVFAALATWGARSPHVPLSGDLTDDSVMAGLRTFFRVGDRKWSATVQVHLEREGYVVSVSRGHLIDVMRREPPGSVDAVIRTDRTVIQGLLTGARSATSVSTAADFTSAGDDVAVRALIAAVARDPG